MNFKRSFNIVSVNFNDFRNSDIEEQWYWYYINISLFQFILVCLAQLFIVSATYESRDFGMGVTKTYAQVSS